MKTAILLNSKVALTPQILAVLSSSNGHGKTNNQSVDFTRKWELLGGAANLVYYFDEMLKAHPKLYQSIRRGEYT